MPTTITVVVAAPDKPTEIREVPNTLETMQAIVGGYVEEMPPAFGILGCTILANEEGMLKGLPVHREWPKGQPIVGPFVVVQKTKNGREWASVPPETAAEVVRILDICWIDRPAATPKKGAKKGR